MKNNMQIDPETMQIENVVRLRFPEGSRIKQIDETAIEITTLASELCELFDERFCTELEKTIGRIPAQIWLEDASERILKELLLKQIR